MSSSATEQFNATAVVARAASLSHYARHLLAADPSLAEAPWDQPFPAAHMNASLAGIDESDEAGLDRTLRKLRQAVMLRLIVRDLAGLADLQEVVTGATSLAEQALGAALRWHDRNLSRQYGRPLGTQSGKPLQLHVIGMGKLGGGELNVSSDIDLIFAYPEEGETDGGRRISAQEYFTRLARKLIGSISETTDDGFVFRVDTRLRPYGDGGPLVVNFDMLEDYFTTQGREWERYAWVKARLLSGDCGAALDTTVRPFVYRRHLDFSALESLRGLHAQIRQEVQRREIAGNIKLGPGGIREVEFLVQVFQMIRGGSEVPLRVRPTLQALTLLGERQLLPADAVAELRGAYIHLRNLEHRLQYRDDQQTQTLPEADEDRQAVAEMMGHAQYASLLRELDVHRAAVTRHFEAIFASTRDNGTAHPQADLWQQTLSDDKALEQISALGYAEAASVYTRLVELRNSARYRRMAASGQARLDQLMPRLLETAAGFTNPDATFERALRVVESIGRRESYLALLLEYPQALSSLARLAAASPWAADYLAQHPILLDELIAPQQARTPDWAGLRGTLRASLDEHADNTERQMDVLRHFKQTQTLRLLALDLSGQLALESLSDHLSDLACTILEEVLRLAWEGLRQHHRDTPQFTIVGYGKLGGKELGYASDLDIIFLYDDAHEAAAETYARLAQRINTWLTSATGAGLLYETDLRLRPNGVAGLLVSQVDAFRDYQFGEAWIWEHQALTRARAVAGDPDIGRRFESIRGDVLRRSRDLAELQVEIRAMRDKMREAHPNKSGLFDLKHDRGGIVDVEFIVQFLVLGHAHNHPELTGNIGNLALLKLAAKLGLIDAVLADGAHAAYREFRALQHQLRLQGERYARVEIDPVAGHTQAVSRLWAAVLGEDRPA
ncbi:MAG TPA: bifunctional [glutamate--ammonia ligase]-adenylyl-L-tyrosine phosphorylase/[glutamate--ammonia-ligase] adenylyltransferase [Burkholderiales bacterium]|nr:bifunctional [glutamate--ammonia ligase]-adenylyl-L-tyrosine phosphorylase/[glutamate--ammonia-ligase] adenylyltransferase [Burkholderiales bacterium]